MPKKGISKESISITLDKGLLKKLDIFCKKNFNAKKSAVIEQAVEKFLKDNGK